MSRHNLGECEIGVKSRPIGGRRSIPMLGLTPARMATLWLCAAQLSWCWLETCAQTTPRPAGLPTVDGMVRSLMESQQATAGRVASPRTTEGRVSPQMREVRANLAGFSQEITQLVTALNQDVNRTPGLRSLMGDALQVSAQANLLARQSASQSDTVWIASEFRELDQSWRLLAFRLRDLRGLNSTTLRYIERATAYHEQLGQLLNITPQVDQEQVVRQATALSTDVYRLLEEVDYEVADNQRRYDLLLEGRRVYQQSRRLASLSRRDIESGRISGGISTAARTVESVCCQAAHPAITLH